MDSFKVVLNAKHDSHVTRFSWDSSWYDEKCINCGATDIAGGGWGKLALPCPNDPQLKSKEDKEWVAMP